ncbi:MAG: tetratricopeptide repeat protein [Prolixibacteraceae bacterium]|nr:tetratricopeptide repeat protein [Prolixibacteraceae bacterium]
MQNRPEEALGYLEAATALDPTNVRAFLYLGIAYLQVARIDDAISTYRKILPQGGEETSMIAYNLGNAYFKSDDVVKAILNYERAKLLAPQNEDIDFNLQIANQYIVDQIETLPQPFFVGWRSRIVNKNSADGWAKISVVSFILFLFLLGSFLFARYVWFKRISFWIGLMAVIVSVSGFSFGNRQKAKSIERNTAIVTSPRVTVKGSPAENGTDLFLIHEGLKVEITGSLNNWKEIRLSDGNKGWLPEMTIERI